MKPICLLALLAAALPCAAADTAKLDEIISSDLKESGAPSVSVAVTENHKIVYAKAFGMADLAHHRAATPDTRYAVGSISKEFTAAALLLLQEQGKLSLDDKVGKYFPDLTRASEITIRELLTHTSGYEDYAPQDYIIPEWIRPTTPEATVNHWAKKPLNFDPGTKWQYSNTNYVLAGLIFEKVSGTPIMDYLREHIFTPLGMTTASDVSDVRPGDALAYTRYALGPPRLVAREGAGWYFADGELCMTASDLARWDIAFLEKRILSAESYQQFTHEAKLPDGKSTHYALGLGIGDLDGTPMVSHSGEVSGFLADNRIFPTKNISVTVLTNEDGLNLIDPLSRRIAEAMWPPDGEISQVTAILDGLQKGRIDSSLFTTNAQSYFSQIALGDFRTSLAPLGKLRSVAKRNESLRGGMTHRSYRADFEKKTLYLNVYVMPDGKIEQFLVEDQLG